MELQLTVNGGIPLNHNAPEKEVGLSESNSNHDKIVG